MNSLGWIILDRKIKDNWLWEDKPFAYGQAWTHLLLFANHEDREIFFDGNPRVVKRGSFITSILKLSDIFGWDRKKTRKFLNLLESHKMVTTVRTTHGTTITIVNYEKYQNFGTADRATKRTTVSPTIGQRFPINNNDNNENNNKLIVSKDTICSTDVKRVIEAWNSLKLDRIVKITEGTQRHTWLKKRIKDYGIETVLEAIEKVRQSTFLHGNNNKGWTITFDWFLRPNNFPKVLGGNYDDKGGKNNAVMAALESAGQKYREEENEI